MAKKKVKKAARKSAKKSSKKKASKKKAMKKKPAKKAAKKKTIKRKAAKKPMKKAAKKPSAGVKIYTTPTCPWCMKTKEFFRAHKVKYQEFDVANDLKARNDMIEKSGQLGVPVIEIGSKIIVGFDEPALKKALKL